MGKIHKGNYFTVSHRIVEWQDDKGQVTYLLSSLTTGALKVYIALCHFANRFNGKMFYMGDVRLSKVTGLSRRQLCRERKILRDMGLIRTFKREGLKLDYEILPVP